MLAFLHCVFAMRLPKLYAKFLTAHGRVECVMNCWQYVLIYFFPYVSPVVLWQLTQTAMCKFKHHVDENIQESWNGHSECDTHPSWGQALVCISRLVQNLEGIVKRFVADPDLPYVGCRRLKSVHSSTTSALWLCLRKCLVLTCSALVQLLWPHISDVLAAEFDKITAGPGAAILKQCALRVIATDSEYLL